MLLYKLFSQGEQSGDNGATKWPIIGQTGYTHTHAHTRSRTQEKLGMARGCLFRKEARLYIWSANVPSFFFFLGRANKVNMGKRRKEGRGASTRGGKLFFLVDFTLYPVYRIPRRRRGGKKLQTNEPEENGVGNSINVFSFGYTDPGKILFFKRRVDMFSLRGTEQPMEGEEKWRRKLGRKETGRKKSPVFLLPSIFQFSRACLLFYLVGKLPKIIVSVLHRCRGQGVGWCWLVPRLRTNSNRTPIIP